MKFTNEQLRNIERTMDKLGSVAHTMWSTNSEDWKNAQHIAYIIGELRQHAQNESHDQNFDNLMQDKK